jgi:hypothetical protein
VLTVPFIAKTLPFLLQFPGKNVGYRRLITQTRQKNAGFVVAAQLSGRTSHVAAFVRDHEVG